MECLSSITGLLRNDGDSSFIWAAVYFAPSMIFNGIISSILYRNFQGTEWKSQMLLSGLFFAVRMSRR